MYYLETNVNIENTGHNHMGKLQCGCGVFRFMWLYAHMDVGVHVCEATGYLVSSLSTF